MTISLSLGSSILFFLDTMNWEGTVKEKKVADKQGAAALHSESGITACSFPSLNHLLATEHTNILTAAERQRMFDCEVCSDTFPEESIARIESCGHPSVFVVSCVT